MNHHLRTLALCAMVLSTVACDPGTNLPSIAFGSPIDFSYACGGETHTFRPTGFTDVDDPSVCDPNGVDPANLFGLVLNREPARIHVLQMTSHKKLDFGIIDADRFIPGFSGIPVEDVPLRLLRNEDWSAFYVLSSGGPSLQRLVIRGVRSNGTLSYSLDEPVPLPSRPSDAILIGDTIWVASATDEALWAYTIDESGGLSEPAVTPTRARIHTIQAAGERLLITWVDRPVLTLMSAGMGTEVSEIGLRDACSDTLDNDGDGLTDWQDPQCRNSHDNTEGDDDEPLTRAVDTVDAVAAYPPEVAPCEDGVDNDNDGLTDAHDPACDDNPFGEWLPACSDGLDNDGDGATDTDDSTCYGAHDLSESQMPSMGPYHATFVDGHVIDEAAERSGADPVELVPSPFVYVLDTARQILLVFSIDADGQLAPVDVPGTDADVEELPYLGYDGREDGTLQAVPRRALKGPTQQGEVGLSIGSVGGVTLNSGQLRGELWSHVVTDRTVTPEAIDWTPGGCDLASDAGACDQPAVDDATWFVFMPTLNGDMLLVEAIRRGVPLHRFAQVTTDPEDRGGSIDVPVLTVRGEVITSSDVAYHEAPFLGPVADEELAALVPDESPRIVRRHGIWPPGYPDNVDFEAVPTESWSLTYEGVVPDTAAARGRFLSGSTFMDPGANFCNAGVEAGDWLTLEVPNTAVDEAAEATAVLTPVFEEVLGQATEEVEEGLTCHLLPATTSLVDIPITGVGATTLSVDLSNARVRPTPPVLDVDAIDADPDLELTACVNGRRAVDLEAQVVDTALTPADLPRLTHYAVRVRDAWAVVGSRSGFLHPNRWDEAEGCVADPDLSDRRYTGRLLQLTDVAESYETCPPEQSLLAYDADTPLHSEDGERFANFSFSLDVFEGCEATEDGVTGTPTQRDTSWSFTVKGPDAPKMTSSTWLSNQAGLVLHSARIPQLELRRQQVQLDTGGRRVHVLQIRANELDHVATFD